MTATFTIIDDQYSANEGTVHKHVFGTVSLTNPYTAGGESITVSDYFKTKVKGGDVTLVNPSVTIDNAGIAATGKFRGDTSSVTTLVLQFYNNGLTGTSKAGLYVDNTVANLSSTTVVVEMWGY